MRAAIARLALLAATALPLAAQSPGRAATDAGATVSWTRVTYISGTSVYLEVGRNQGVTDRTVFEVVRRGAAFARLRVTALASNRTACESEPPTADVAVGDSVRFTPARTASPAVAASGGGARTASRSTARPLRGRLGVRYLVLDADAGGLTQPAYDLRLDGERLGGSGFGLTADVRAQQTRYAASPSGAARASVNATRVYQAALTWTAPRAGVRFTAGRQLAGALSSVGLFDGVAIDVDRGRFGAGAFAGEQPQEQSFGISSRIREYGAYASVHRTPGSGPSAALTLGGVGSYVAGEIDREYAFARLTSNGPMFSVYATQELDFNRGWKRDAEHTATTPTATFVSAHITPSRWLSLFGGFDNRRSVRLYRDYQNPELSFDDAFREGTWEGISLSAPRYARLSVDRRDSRGGLGGTAGVTTAMASVTGYTRARLGVRGRYTLFEGPTASGQLVSGAFEIDPWGVVRVEANGGRRVTNGVDATVPATTLTWVGGDADIGVGRSLYIMLSAYRERDGDRASLQSYVSISWRF